MAAQHFKSGDFVQLKSGGPKMTVTAWQDYNKKYGCKWFAGSKLNQADFAEGELQRWAPDEPAEAKAK